MLPYSPERRPRWRCSVGVDGATALGVRSYDDGRNPASLLAAEFASSPSGLRHTRALRWFRGLQLNIIATLRVASPPAALCDSPFSLRGRLSIARDIVFSSPLYGPLSQVS